MLGNFACWFIALALILSKSPTPTDLYIKLAFALGFIFVGAISKAIDYRHGIGVGSSKNSGKNEKVTVVNNCSNNT
jgi:hypothetical protein